MPFLSLLNYDYAMKLISNVAKRVGVQETILDAPLFSLLFGEGEEEGPVRIVVLDVSRGTVKFPVK